MSHPSRPPGGHPPGWAAPSPFRPASPYATGRGQGPSTPVHPASPVPIGGPVSPRASPVFGGGYIQCPRPRWPSAGIPRPYVPTQIQSPLGSASASPLPCGPPEYLIAPYRPGEYEYVGVPLDPDQGDEESSGPSTAEIIASQSQDYVDEKLAEYQATIQQLQDGNRGQIRDRRIRGQIREFRPLRSILDPDRISGYSGASSIKHRTTPALRPRNRRKVVGFWHAPPQ
ncbi:vegetative cell wall protein gp1-like [Orussus abietinus]|uniref:vegetative cell wall protein gp1-like n=1 Tax=Orussus abietinus TaxID=222816 RepID=UPI00062656A8|nr:vegetative cell wall protein gp1-like [Orussus abietinus]